MTLTPEAREKIINAFDIARQEGMLHSKDGKHSESSESEADDVIDFILAKLAAVTPDEMVEIMAEWLHTTYKVPPFVSWKKAISQRYVPSKLAEDARQKARQLFSQLLPYFEEQKAQVVEEAVKKERERTFKEIREWGESDECPHGDNELASRQKRGCDLCWIEYFGLPINPSEALKEGGR